MASVSISTINSPVSLLLEQVVNRLVDLRQNKRRNMFDNFQDKTGFDGNERGIFIPEVINQSQSFSASTDPEADYPKASAPEFERLTVGYRLVQTATMVNDAVLDNLRSGRTNPATWDSYSDFAKDALDSMIENLDTYLAGDGTGTLGTLQTNPDGSLTSYVMNTAWSVERLAKNQKIVIANPADLSLRTGGPYTISQSPVASTRTFTTSAAINAAAAANDLVVLENTIDAVPYGIDYHVSASTATWQGVNPSTNAKYRAREEDFGGTTGLTFARLTKMTASIYPYLNTDYSLESIQGHRWMVHPVQYVIMRQLGIPYSQLFTNTGGTPNLAFGVGYKGMTFDGIPILQSIKLRRDRIYLVDMSQFFRTSLNGKFAPQMAAFNDGTRVLSIQRPDLSTITDSVVTRQKYSAWYSYMNIGCFDRRPHIKGIQLIHTGDDVPA